MRTTVLPLPITLITHLPAKQATEQATQAAAHEATATGAGRLRVGLAPQATQYRHNRAQATAAHRALLRILANIVLVAAAEQATQHPAAKQATQHPAQAAATAQVAHGTAQQPPERATLALRLAATAAQYPRNHHRGYYAEQAGHQGAFRNTHIAEFVADTAQEALFARVLGVVLHLGCLVYYRFQGLFLLGVHAQVSRHLAYHFLLAWRVRTIGARKADEVGNE